MLGSVLRGARRDDDPGSAGRSHVFATADDGAPPTALVVTAPKNHTNVAGQTLTADFGSVTGGVHGSTGYQARVQWGDGTGAEDATISSSGEIGRHHTPHPSARCHGHNINGVTCP